MRLSISSLLKNPYCTAISLAFKRLLPQYLIHQPILFALYLATLLTTFIYVINDEAMSHSHQFTFHVMIWLWLTLLFANFSEAIAERKGKAQAHALKKAKQDLLAKKIASLTDKSYQLIGANDLHYDDLILVEPGDIIPGDGQVVEGIASVDESAITGESAPVIREKGSDRDSVTAGTTVLSDWIIVRITSNPGESFLDRMIALVEGGKRQKTPNEIALTILLAGMTLIFLIVCATLVPLSAFSTQLLAQGTVLNVVVLVALFVCLIPTTIGGLISAIGISGINRLMLANVIATSGRAVEAAGDINILLLDKTGTITLGNRQAISFYPAKDVSITELAAAAELSSLADDTPEGKSILALARNKYDINATNIHSLNATFIPFSAETRMSGIEIGDQKIVKGAIDSMVNYMRSINGQVDAALITKTDEIARLGNTPLLVADKQKILGAIELKDIIKPGIKARLAELRRMGIKSIMITGDNPLTAATIANEAGVDDYVPQATPEKKLQVIKKFQEECQLIAMAGDGTNDAPALAQTDVAVVMNSGTQAAKDAANMIDLDSDPTKIIEIIKIGKQLLMTRGALTTFSIANDVAKYFAIIPAAFAENIPALLDYNIMHLATPKSAMLAAVIFNAVSIIGLIPLALRGVKFAVLSPNQLLWRNTFIYGLGGLLAPFIGIKMIDILLNFFRIL